MNSFTEENYLKAIYKLLEDGSESVSTNAIAARVSTRAASVTDMLKKLSAKKLINYRKYQGVSLTPAGKKIALSVIRKHRLWEMFLADKLHFGWDEVHEIAEQLEHIRSDELIDRIDKFLGYPPFDPHGDPIPDAKGKIKQSRSLSLSDAALGDILIMTGVVDHSPAFLHYLDSIALRLGDELQVSEMVAYDRSLHLLINKKKKIQISHEAARNILVRKK